jgi:adenylate cyclase
VVNLGEANLFQLPSVLTKRTQDIQRLNLQGNLALNLKEEFLAQCHSLKELNMAQCELVRVPTSIRHCASLIALDISLNRLQNIEHAHLESLTHLQVLIVKGNFLTTIPDEWSKFQKLDRLDLSNNDLVEFPSVLCQLAQLSDLRLSFNHIQSFPSNMASLSKLSSLIMAGNKITGSLPHSFSYLNNLMELDLRFNSITDVKSVFNLPKLTSLYCERNPIAFLSTSFPPSLRRFMMKKNNLTRFTNDPVIIPGFTLEYLDISHGQLPTLPENLFDSCVGLERLKLDHNHLTTLPKSIKELSRLKRLSVTNNALTTIPTEIGSCENLELLYLNGNNLRDLPSEIWYLPRLRILNASSNLLSKFPSQPNSKYASQSVKLMESLNVLILGDNRISDTIFPVISELALLKILNLSCNLIVEIPQGVFNKFPYLEELYLGGNQISVLVNDDVARWRNLRSLFINGNRLDSVPAGIGKIGKLSSLDISCNLLRYNVSNWPYEWNW